MSNITDAGLQNLSQLRELYLGCNENITNAGLPNLLEVLHLRYNNKITDAGLRNLSQLRTLSLAHNHKIFDSFHPVKISAYYIFWLINDKRIREN